MATVWKYAVEISADPTILRMPQGARIVHVEPHVEYAGMPPTTEIWMWATIPNPSAEVQHERSFVIVGTGNAIPADATYVGTTQQGPWVWHIFEVQI